MAKRNRKIVPAEQIEQFYSDLTDIYALGGMRFAKFLRAPVKKSGLFSLVLPKIPDGVDFFCASDLPQNEVEVCGEKISLFASCKIDFLGQPLGVFVGRDKSVLSALCDEAKILCDELPQDEPYFLAEEKIFGDADFLEKALADEPEKTYNFPLAQNSAENAGALASYEKNFLHIYSPIRWTKLARHLIAQSSKTDESAVCLHTTFSHQNDASTTFMLPILASILASVAVRLNTTIKYVASQDEDTNYFKRDPNVKAEIKSKISDGGELSALSVKVFVDVGIFNPVFDEICHKIILESAGVFCPKNFKAQIFAKKSSLPPSNLNFLQFSNLMTRALNLHLNEKVFSQNLDPVVFFAQNTFLNLDGDALQHSLRSASSSRDIQKLNKKMQTDGISDLQNRILDDNEKASKKNEKIVKNDFFLDLPCKKFAEAFQSALKASDFSHKYSAFKSEKISPFYAAPIRAISFAMGMSACGPFKPAEARKFWTMEVSAESASKIKISYHNICEKSQGAWKKIVRDFFPADDIQVIFEDSPCDENFSLACDIMPAQSGISQQLLQRSCAELKKNYSSGKFPLRVKKFWMPPKKSEKNPFSNVGWLLAICEAEIDSVTFEPFVREFWLALDAGQMFDKKNFEKIIRSKVENVLRAQSKSRDLPKINIFAVESNEKPKDCEEILESVVVAAFKSAVNQKNLKILR